MSDLRSRIESARMYAGISSQEKLAAAVGIGRQTFMRRMRGEYGFRRGDLLAIAEVCEVPIEFIETGWDAFQVKPGYVKPGIQPATPPGEAPDVLDLGRDLLGRQQDDEDERDTGS